MAAAVFQNGKPDAPCCRISPTRTLFKRGWRKIANEFVRIIPFTNPTIELLGGFMRGARLLRRATDGVGSLRVGFNPVWYGLKSLRAWVSWLKFGQRFPLRSVPQRQSNQPFPCISIAQSFGAPVASKTSEKGGGIAEAIKGRGIMRSKVVIVPISNPHALPESTEEGILSQNLVQMRSSMMRLLMDESVGGNAGTIEMAGKPFSCAAARGFADAQSGKIIAFGNYQDVPGNIRSVYPEFVFRIVVGFGRGSPLLRIIECSSDTSFSSQAKAMLEKSVERWNSTSAVGRQAA